MRVIHSVDDFRLCVGFGYTFPLCAAEGEIDPVRSNSVVSHLVATKVHVILRSFVVLTWMHDIVEFV